MPLLLMFCRYAALQRCERAELRDAAALYIMFMLIYAAMPPA